MHDYVTEEESLPALRGSLRYRDQATRRFGQLDTLECRYDDFRSNILENQLVRTGLQVAARSAGDKALSKRLRRLELAAADLTDEGPIESSFYAQRLSYSRRKERYRRAHQLALLLLDNVGVQDLYGSGKTKSFAFLLNMNDLFEDFVATLISDAFATEPWQVTSQHRVRSVIQDRTTGRRYASTIPDIVMANRDATIPFDCKYKLYGSGKKISTSDIFQSFLYAFALSEDMAGGSRAGIIYPSSKPGVAPQLSIKSVDGPTSAQLTGIGVDIVGVLSAMDDADAWARTLQTVRSSIGKVLDPTTAPRGT